MEGVPGEGSDAPPWSDGSNDRVVNAIVISEGYLVTVGYWLPGYRLVDDVAWEEALAEELFAELEAVVVVDRLVMTNLRTQGRRGRAIERWYLCRLIEMPDLDGRVRYLSRDDVESGHLEDLEGELLRTLLDSWPDYLDTLAEVPHPSSLELLEKESVVFVGGVTKIETDDDEQPIAGSGSQLIITNRRLIALHGHDVVFRADASQIARCAQAAGGLFHRPYVIITFCTAVSLDSGNRPLTTIRAHVPEVSAFRRLVTILAHLERPPGELQRVLRQHFEERVKALDGTAKLETEGSPEAYEGRSVPIGPGCVGVVLYLPSYGGGTVSLDDQAFPEVELTGDPTADIAEIDEVLDIAIAGRATTFRFGSGGCTEITGPRGVQRRWLNALPWPGWRRRAVTTHYLPYRPGAAGARNGAGAQSA
ncbi:hypothetical protein [Leifsonia sp. C5G2]|uniref:hypothetical protein n=1 Tax=Leifsonia sp. C5G2 TaxID=2735269 RepID=UPI001585A219|nr:hypothetical protein [Leifsonia sp. C5G2]